MKTRFYQKLLPILCALALILGPAATARAAGTPTASDNALRNYYQMSGKATESFLYANPSGGLTRVELIGSKYVVEDYSSSFQLLNSRSISIELPRCGGFFAGQDYNFLIYGQRNPNESDSTEVVRVVKYDKNWNRLGQASVYGANTVDPFNGGAVRCAESGGMLYIHTCHTMYKDSSGTSHQANMNITVRQSDMQVAEASGGVSDYTNYVSHSFNQYVIVDSLGNIITADHGDAHPRAMVIHKMPGAAGGGSMSSNQTVLVQTGRFIGATGDNLTNAQLGGLAETSSGYLIAYEQRNILADPSQMKLAYIAKSDFASGAALQVRQLTNVTNTYEDQSTPFLVPTGLDGGWILWNTRGETTETLLVEDRPNMGLRYARYSADGSVGPVQSVNKAAPLSDCQPIYYNGKVVWYTTDNSAPVFYSLDASGVTATPANGSPSPVTGEPERRPTPISSGSFSDVPASHWAYQDIAGSVALGAVTGYQDGSFRPEEAVTVSQFILMLERVFYPDELKEMQEECAGKPWYVAVLKLGNSGKGGCMPLHYLREIWEDWSNDYKNTANIPLTRFFMASMVEQVVYREKGGVKPAEYEYLKREVTDYNGEGSAATNLWLRFGSDVFSCMHRGIISGLPDGSYSGEKTVTRAQACAIINRLYKIINN